MSFKTPLLYDGGIKSGYSTAAWGNENQTPLYHLMTATVKLNIISFLLKV